MTQSTDFLAELAVLAEKADHNVSNPAYLDWALCAWENRAAILALGRERDELRKALRTIEQRADGYASDHASCYNCVDVNSIARQALEGDNQ